MEYLVLGHITADITQTGMQIGGTAAYASITARALGCQAAVLTTCASHEPDLSPLGDIPIFGNAARCTTVFENRQVGTVRHQRLEQWAGPISLADLPDAWTMADIVHFAPVAREVDPHWVDQFNGQYKGITPQGLMRIWDQSGMIQQSPHLPCMDILPAFDAVIFSLEDVGADEDIIEIYAQHAQVLAVTEAAQGVRMYWRGDMRHFSAPSVQEIDSTGAGDIFAAAFFYRHLQTRDPWEAARFAVQLAALSVTRSGLDSIPTPEEIRQQTIEIL